MNDLTGSVFGRLTVIAPAGSVNGNGFCHCRCSCGQTTKTRADHLLSGRSKSCGCLRKEVVSARRTSHGLTTGASRGSRTYIAWAAMRFRCNNPKSNSYQRYGGRGITVCPEWNTSFIQFHSDMGDCPPGMSIERQDNSNGYSPDNCRWATSHDQNRNRRSNRLMTHDGVTLCATDWAQQVGIPPSTLLSRLHRGWSDARALTTPTRHRSTS